MREVWPAPEESHLHGPQGPLQEFPRGCSETGEGLAWPTLLPKSPHVARQEQVGEDEADE